MTKTISALTARTQFGQIMKRATTNGERFLVDRRGEPSVVIMGVRDYIDTMAPAPGWLKESWEASRRNGTDTLSMRDIDADIKVARRDLKAKQSKPVSRKRK